MGNNIFEMLKKEAAYALNSHNRDLVYQTYGMAQMAFSLEEISREQFYELNDELVTNGLNGRALRKVDCKV